MSINRLRVWAFPTSGKIVNKTNGVAWGQLRFCNAWLTKRKQNGRIKKIESLEIEARDSSVSFDKARQPSEGKGETAEVSNVPERCLLGRQRRSAVLSQTFVERYRLQ